MFSLPPPRHISTLPFSNLVKCPLLRRCHEGLGWEVGGGGYPSGHRDSPMRVCVRAR
jgi:hypothetical protein